MCKGLKNSVYFSFFSFIFLVMGISFRAASVIKKTVYICKCSKKRQRMKRCFAKRQQKEGLRDAC